MEFFKVKVRNFFLVVIELKLVTRDIILLQIRPIKNDNFCIL